MADEPHTRWGHDAPSSFEEARKRLIRATEVCFEKFGVHKATVGDIALQAQVSRPTVYRYFPGGRDELTLAVLLRETAHLSDELHEILEGIERLDDKLVEVILTIVRRVPEDAKLRMLLSTDTAGRTSSLAANSEAVLAAAQQLFGPFLGEAEAEGYLRPGARIDWAIEFLIRQMMSLLIMGSGNRSDAELREYLMMFIVPAILNGEDRPHDSNQ
ncbi:MAG: TetR/AcrR family transcriptional regulator [Ilumatobacteraceae bacterium]|nr:TetR/AcrR family transcriptional regulator [Ilumatobacteraceae bacterium]